MMGLRKYGLVCAVCLCWACGVRQLPAQQIEASQPDAGMPPQPGASTPAAIASSEERLGRIASVLADRCLACHGADKQEGGYSVASFAELRKSGDSGEQPLVAGQPEASELYRRLVTSDAAERMPAESEPLESEPLALIRTWIAGGTEVPPALEQRPLAQWPRSDEPISIPEHYPAALPIAALAIVPDGQSIWTSGYGEIIQWNLTTGQLLERRRVAGTQIADIDISGDGRYLAVSSGTPGTRGIVQVWQLSAPPAAAPVWTDASSDIAADIAFSPTEARLAIGLADGSLRVVDLAKHADVSHELAATFTPHADAVLSVAWSDAGDRMITGSLDRTAKIFDARTMDLIANYDRHQRAVGGVAYTGSHPVSLDETGQLRLWAGDDSDRTLAEQSNLPRFLEHLAASDERVYLAAGSDVRVFRVEQKQTEDGKDDAGKPKTKTTTRWREDQRLQSGGPGWIMSLSTAGDWLAAGTESGEVIVWDENVPTPKLKFSAKP